MVNGNQFGTLLQPVNIIVKYIDVCIHILTLMLFCLAAHGDYYRLLLNGKYMVTASKKGFVPVSHIVVVRNHPKKGATKVDFAMTPNVAV